MRALACILLTASLAGCAEQPPTEANADTVTVPAPIRAPNQSGFTFLQPETQALQSDDFANPGYLWVDKGSDLFQTPGKNGKNCSTCHTDDSHPLDEAAAHYPKYDATTQQVINIEGRINHCRTAYQDQPPLAYESEDLLALTAYVANLARGVPVNVTLDASTQASYDRGETYFMTRRGQFNLSCSQCHDDNWGKKLRGDTISQGHGNGFPAYRLEWQTLGSLHKRFQYCDIGVRAEPLEGGSQTYIDLELYLSHRSNGLPIETPAVRR